MNYKSSMTDVGNEMIAQAHKDDKAIIFDSFLVSEALSDTDVELTKTTKNLFSNPLTYPINSKATSDNTFTVKAVLANKTDKFTVDEDFSINVIGVLAHIDGSSDSRLITIAVAEGTGAVINAFRDTLYSLTVAITQAYKADQPANFGLANVAYALADDLDKLKTDIQIIIDGGLTNVAKINEENTFTKSQTLAGGATDGAGNAIATTKNVSDGDAETLKSANAHADSGDTATLTSANSHADTGDANTLASAKKYADDNFAKKGTTGGVEISGVDLEKDADGHLKYGDDLILMANKPQAPTLVAAMDYTVNQPKWTVTLPQINGGASIVSVTVEYCKNGDADWASIQSAVSTLSGHVTGLTGNSEYEFRAFVTNYAGDSPYSSTQTVKTMDDRIFGASWDMSSDPKLTRTDAAVGLVAGINGAQNDFDTIGPWAKMDKTITDDKGNAFVRIPKLYIKKTQTDKLATWQVSLSKIDDTWYLPKCFWDFTNSKELDYVDVGRYQGTVAGNLLQSKSGVAPTNSLAITAFRSDAKANGDSYQLLDIHVVDVWQVLFIIEFATLSSQSIMPGNLDNGANGSAKTNGAGSNHAGSSGYATSTGPMDYRGIENMYGNLYQFVDGINITNQKPWVCDDSTKYQSDLFATPYQPLNYALPASGFITKMGYDPKHPFAQFAAVANGTLSTYYTDYQYATTGNMVASYGDCWNSSVGYGGAFHWFFYYASSGTNVYRGSRLIRRALV